MMEVKKQPCVFCGTQAEFQRLDNYLDYHFIECPVCGAYVVQTAPFLFGVSLKDEIASYLYYSKYSKRIPNTENDKNFVFLGEKEVFEELVSGDNNKEDLLKEYIKNNKKIFVYEYNEEIEIIFIGLIEDPDIVKLLDNKNNKNGADVLILAYAKYFDSTVVTRDSALINICKKYNIRIFTST